jgi:outer membrane receptor for ferrienterochelin and colicin
VEVESQGFKKYVHRGVVLEINQNARVDVKLELGAVTQEVVVQGDVASVDTHQAQLGSVVDTRRINDLPLNGRNVYSLVTQLPGVTGTTLQAQPDVAQGNQMNLNGSRMLQTSFLLDGGLNNNVWRDGGLMSPNPDAVEEFRLITSNYNAEYGRSGGGIVNVITKSGTNQFHGALYEYLRNDDLDARSFFNPSVSILKQNQFGGTVGGPVKHDKLFFFFSYEGTRQVWGSS